MADSILNSVILLVLLGTVAALVLYVVSKKFYVYEDPLIDTVEDLCLPPIVEVADLPGCRAFAEKLVGARTNISDLFCPVGGNDVMKQVAAAYWVKK